MKICAKCGKANDVIRTYCTRCGTSLLKQEEDLKLEQPESIPESDSEVIEAGLGVEEPKAEAESLSASDKEQLVRPSEVASRELETKDSEFEVSKKVKEEVHEYVDIETEEEAVAPEPEQLEKKEGKAVVKEILAKVRAAEARTKAEMAAPEPEPIAPSEAELVEEIDEPTIHEEPEVEVEAKIPYQEEPEPPPPEEMAIKEPLSVAPSVSEAAPYIARDEKIRVIESDIRAFNIERQQLNSEFDKLRSRLDEEVGRYLTVAETKRTRTEGIERELRLAKKEYEDANKEYKNAENRRKKELSNAEKRIRDVDKRIKKAESTKRKRIEQLEKERKKQEEEAKKA